MNSFLKASCLRGLLLGAGMLLFAFVIKAASMQQEPAKPVSGAEAGTSGKGGIADPYANLFPDVVAKVNGKPISGRELEREIRKELVPIGSPKWTSLKEDYRGKLVYSMVTSLVNSKLLYDEAAAHGIRIGDSEVQDEFLKMESEFPKGENLDAYLRGRGFDRTTAVAELHKTLMINKFIDETIRKKVSVTPEEMSKFYNEHPNEFKHPDIVRTSQIIIASGNSPEADAKAGQLVKSLMERIEKGEDFAALARQYSQSPTASRGGDIGFASKEALGSEYAEAAFSLPVGGVKLFELPQGYRILKVTDKKSAGKSTLEEAKEDLMEFLKTEKIQLEIKKTIDRLRDKSEIDILIPAGVLLE